MVRLGNDTFNVESWVRWVTLAVAEKLYGELGTR